MKTIVFLATTKITEKYYREFVKHNRRFVMLDREIAEFENGKPIVMVGAGIAEENPDLADVLKRFSKGKK